MDQISVRVGQILDHLRNAPADRDRLAQWVIYDHPNDYPDTFMARLWHALPQPSATPYGAVAENLDELRQALSDLGFTRVARELDDDPCILEVWL